MASDFFSLLGQYQSILTAISISLSVGLLTLGFVWRSMKTNVENAVMNKVTPMLQETKDQVFKKVDAATIFVSDKLNEQNTVVAVVQNTLETIKTGQKAISDNVTNIQASLQTSADILNKHVLESTKDRAELRATVNQHEERLKDRIARGIIGVGRRNVRSRKKSK